MQSLTSELLTARLNAVLSQRFVECFPDDLQRQSVAQEVAARYQPGETPWRVQEWDDAVAPRTRSWVVHRSDDTEVYRDEERRRAEAVCMALREIETQMTHH